LKEMKMKTITIAVALVWHAVCLLSLTQMTARPLNAQVHTPETADVRGGVERSIVLYEGPLVHDQQWVMTPGTTNTQLLGVFGGTCSMVSSKVRNVKGLEQVRFEAEYQGFGVWKMAWVDTVVGNAVADTGQRYRYTYHVRISYTGITTDGKAPNPSRAMPTPTSEGFLEAVPGNVVAAALKLKDLFMLQEETTGRLVADAQVVGWLHFRTNPSEQPPAFFPFVLDGYIATTLQTVAGEAGCDPL
jgi:hypothetical protein